MGDKLTVRWEDPRIEAMALRGQKEEGFDTLSDYVRAAIVRDRFLSGDKEAVTLAKENFLKWWRQRAFYKKIRLVTE
jgi:hypothetical protein